jgi:serine/threonine protein kinase
LIFGGWNKRQKKLKCNRIEVYVTNSKAITGFLMSLPNEYVIEEVVRNIDDIAVYRADHPIHGLVNIYLPDGTLPPEILKKTGQRLFQKGLKMRELSIMNLPLIAKALEVSQNPNEPYIVTQYIEHDLEWLISNGVILKPKRMFTILSQILEAITHLTTNGWAIDRIHPRQIKLPQLNTGDISFALAEGFEQQSGISQMTDTVTADNFAYKAAPTKFPEDSINNNLRTPQTESTQKINEDETIETPPIYQDAAVGTLLNDFNDPRQLRRRQRGIYLLGNITYQLLFGRKYDSGDDHAKKNIKGLGKRWRTPLEKAFEQDIDHRYDTYNAMQMDVTKALKRNKRIAAMSAPFLIILVIIACYFAYERYHEYKIMTSEAGQAIESFLEIINETKDEFPEIEKPKPPPAKLDEQAILKPFDKISAVEDN